MTNTQQIILDIDAKVKSAEAATSLRELKQLTRELQGEALKYQGVNEEAFQAAQRAAAGLVDRMDDVREAIVAAKGEPLEQLNSGFSLLKQSVADLDFDKATVGINAMAKGVKSIDIGKLSEGFGKFMSAVGNLGKTLLTNPIFLMGSAIALIITNFEKLSKVGGVVGGVFKGLGFIIDTITEGITNFTDALGLTDIAGQKLQETLQSLRSVQEDLNSTYRSGSIEIAKLQGRSTVLLEYYQIYADKISNINTKISDFIEVNKDMLSMLGVDLRALMEIPPDQDPVTGMIKLPQTFIQQMTKLGKLGKEELDKIKSMYLDFRKAIIAVDEQFVKEMEKTSKAESESSKKSALERARIISEGRQREIKMVKLTNQEAIDEQKKQEDLEVDRLKDMLEARKKYYVGAQQALQIQQKAGLISMGDYVWQSRELMMKEKDELQQIEDLKTKVVKDGAEIRTAMRLKEKDDIKKINLRADIDIIEAQKTNIDKELQLDLRALESKKKTAREVMKVQGKSVEEIAAMENENARKQLEKKTDALDSTFDLEKVALEKQMKLYADDNAKVMVLKKSLELLEREHIQRKIEMNREYIDTVKSNNEQASKDTVKAVEADMTELYQKISQNIDNEIQTLEKGDEATRMQYGKRMTLVKAYWAMQSGIIEEARKKELKAVDESNVSEEEKARKRYEINKEYNLKEKLNTAKTEKEKVAIREEAISKVADLARTGADVLGSIMEVSANADAERVRKGSMTEADAKKRAFRRQKALSLVNVGINTAEAISKAVAASPTTGGLPFSAIAGVIGAAQIAAILSKKYDPGDGSGADTGGGGGGGETITAPTMAVAPSAPLMGQGYLNQNFNPMTFGGQLGFKPGGEQRVYVLESDITNLQNRVKVMESRSTLSGTV